jgi:SAM-dependent methyltransferase
MSSITEMTLTTSVPDVTWTHRALPLILDAIPVSSKSLLDAGCGRGIIGALCRIYRSVDHLVGIEGFESYLEFSQKSGFYDETILRNLTNLPLPFQRQEFDVVTCIEVIEHLEKSAGEKLLDELERIGSRVIVTTPNILFQQHEYDGNALQRHLSHWRPSDFRKRGYDVYGAGSLNVGYGVKRVVERVAGRGGNDVAPGRVRQSARHISEILGPLTRNLPSLSTSLLCVKSRPAD